MHRWCRLTEEQVISPGDFAEARLLTISGAELRNELDFLRHLAMRLMDTYEGTQAGELAALELHTEPERPERTRSFYHLLFETDGTPTDDFRTWASENVAAWLEESFDTPYRVSLNPPHNNEPGYDLIAAYDDVDSLPWIRLVQVKATQGNLRWNCNGALDGFKQLEAGDYNSRLNAKLHMMERTGDLPVGASARELVFDLDRRRYRVVAVHEEDRDTIQIMTTYDVKLPGERARRSARLVRVTGWQEFWMALGAIVYAQLA
jgi:hypothetical protein